MTARVLDFAAYREDRLLGDLPRQAARASFHLQALRMKLSAVDARISEIRHNLLSVAGFYSGLIAEVEQSRQFGRVCEAAMAQTDIDRMTAVRDQLIHARSVRRKPRSVVLLH